MIWKEGKSSSKEVDFYNKTKSSERVFCSAPFGGFYQGLDGQISVCCQTPVLIDNNNYDEAVHDPKIVKLRQDFLNGNLPEECKNCTPRVRQETTELCGLEEKDQFTLDYHKPVFLDLLWSNKCNFACMGCSPRISSAMLKYKSAIDLVDPMNEGSANYEWNSKDEQQNRIEYILKNRKTIKAIHLNGGEPLMQEGFYDLLERLIELDATHIGIWSHTNGSISKYRGKNIIDLLKQFDICENAEPHDHSFECRSLVVMSHDGIGEQGEYVRYGLKQNVWLKNYNKFFESGIRTDVQVCYSIFNCLKLEEMADWYEEHLHVTPNLSLWNWPPAYSGKYIRKIPKLYDKAMDILETHGKRFRKYEYVLDFMKEPVEDKELIDMHYRFSESISKFDELRGTDFETTFPELKELYY
jgi:organic radical activating enzyme